MTRGRAVSTKDPEVESGEGDNRVTMQRHCTPSEDVSASVEGVLFLCSLIGVLLLESFHPSSGVDELLLACEERMAIRTDFHANHIALESRPRLKGAATSTVHSYRMVIGMNTLFHRKTPFLPAVLRDNLRG